MSRKTLWTLGKELEKYFQELRDGDRSETTIQDYRWTLWNMFRGLDEAGMTVNPRKIGREEIEYIRKVHYEGRSGGYIAGQIKCLLIFCRWAGKLYSYHKTSVDELVKGVGERLGFEVTNHDLRRTCGRMMYRSGVKIEVIMRLFGHCDTKTTIRYLGLDFDDMSGAMVMYADYQRGLMTAVPQMGTNGESQLDGGRAGIRSRQEDWLIEKSSAARNMRRFRESMR